MPQSPEGKIFSPTPQDRQEEQRYVQHGEETHQEHAVAPTVERLQQGEDLIRRMEQTIEGLMHEIDSGNLDAAAREQAFQVMGQTMWELETARKHMALALDRYVGATAGIREKAAEMEQDIRRLGRALDAERSKNRPDAVVVKRLEDAYDEAHTRMLQLRDEFEDLSAAIPGDAPIREQTRADEDAAKQTFTNMLQIDADRQKVIREQLPSYDIEVGGIIDEIAMLEQAFDYSIKKKGITQAKLRMLHDGLAGAERRLFDLDVRSSAATISELRGELLSKIDALREKYPADMQQVEPSEVAAPSSPAASAAGLSRVRGLHQEVVAAYAVAMPNLAPDERRSYRTRIAQLSALVRHAEHAEWRRLFKASGRPAQAVRDHDYFKSRAHVRTSASLALNRASHLAPTIAQNISVVIPAKRTIFSVIGDAFKLK